MLNLKPPESSCACDFLVERSKRQRDDSDPWNVAWPSDTHRRLEVLGDNMVVINWMNGLGRSRAMSMLFLSVVWWINLCGGSWVVLSGRELMRMIGVGISFVSRTKLRDTHANWLMDNGDSGPGAQWMAPDLHDEVQKSRHLVLSFDETRRESGLGADAWILWLRGGRGSFEKVSYGGRVLRNALAMTAEREALKLGTEYLTVLFPTEVSSFVFQVESTDRTVQ